MGFQVAEAPKSASFELLPEGGYRAIVAKIERKYADGNVHNNWYNVEFHLIPYDGVPNDDDPVQGRKVWDRYTFEHANPDAVRIGRAQLGDFLFALDIPGFESDEELKREVANRELYIKLGQRKDNRGELVQCIRGYWSMDGKSRSSKQPIPAPPKDAAPARTPWARDNSQSAYPPASAPHQAEMPPHIEAEIPF